MLIARILRTAAALAFVTGPLIAQSDSGKTVEWRSHFEVADAKSGAAYRITEIVQLPNTSEDRDILLLEDRVSGNRLLIREVLDYLNHESRMEVTDLQTKETLTSSSPLPYKSITRDGAVDEAKKNPSLSRSEVTSITLNVNGVEYTASESEWRSLTGAREKRSALRQAASAQFLERLERLRAVAVANSPLGLLGSKVLRYILYGQSCDAAPLSPVPSTPDCTFDGSFGFACSKAQRDKVERAAAAKQLLAHY